MKPCSGLLFRGEDNEKMGIYCGSTLRVVQYLKWKRAKEWVSKELKADHDPAYIISIFPFIHMTYSVGKRLRSF